MKPIISIITPVWNGLPFLKECVDSVLAQDFQAWELLISDNGSTDGTRLYLDSLADPRIRIFKQEKNLGIMGNVNFLFKQAKASLSQILCADDFFIGTTSLKVIVDYWQSAPPQQGFVRFNHCEVSNLRTVELEKQITPAIIPAGCADIWFFTLGNIPGNLSNVSLRTSVVEEAGYFDEQLPSAGDFDFWIRVAGKFGMGTEKETVIGVRRHAKVASNYLNLKGQVIPQQVAIYERLIDRLSVSYSRRKLVNYFNQNICAMHYRIGIKAALRGQFAYLKRLLNMRSSIVWPTWRLLTAGLPFALFNNRKMLTIGRAKALLLGKPASTKKSNPFRYEMTTGPFQQYNES